MTVERGQDWGTSGPLPDDGVIAHTDAEAARIVQTARDAGVDPPAVGLVGGDLRSTLGGRGSAASVRSDHATRAVVDVGLIEVDGVERVFLAHAVARRGSPVGWWWGRIVAILNAAHYGSWNPAPRAHPGDGRLDILDVTMPTGQRTLARSRLITGDHLPHPDISVRRRADFAIDLARPATLYLDGERVGRVRRLVGRVEPEALLVVV